MKNNSPPSKIIFASSSSVFSINPPNPLPRTVSDPVEATDHYTQHKLECEKLVKESGLDWAVFRFGVVPPVMFSLKPWVFHITLDTHMQFLHPQDVGLALANATSCDEVWGKTLLIGSGHGSQICYRDFIGAVLGAMGVGMLPDEAFSTRPYYTVWMDTSESQSILNYQHNSFEEFAREMPKLMGYRRYRVRLFRPYYRRQLLKKSPYLPANRNTSRDS